jgi:hypothetical protein
MEALPPPRRTALSPSPVVPLAIGSADHADQSDAPAPPASGGALVPAPRHELPAGGRPGLLPRLRIRPAPADAVVFIASCPACGADATWSEEREDTRLRAAVDCPCG